MDKTKPVLIVAKKSSLELYGQELGGSRLDAVLKCDSEVAQRLQTEHAENLEAVSAVRRFFDERTVSYRCITESNGTADADYSLMVCVGGDGTLLHSSHMAVDLPVVGINARPRHSVGHFCLATREDFPVVLDGILSGKIRPRELMRMDVVINGHEQGLLILNDILYTAVSPGATTQYRLAVGERTENQRGAGIWVSTPSGSTAGIRSAGGVKMDLAERRMQYLVRELYRGPNGRFKLESGFFEGGGLNVTNLTLKAAVYVDGHRTVLPLEYGDVVAPMVSAHPLRIWL